MMVIMPMVFNFVTLAKLSGIIRQLRVVYYLRADYIGGDFLKMITGDGGLNGLLLL